MKMIFNVNNGRTIRVTQSRSDGPVYVATISANGAEQTIESINAGDFVTMLNWYQFQLSEGNINLSFAKYKT